MKNRLKKPLSLLLVLVMLLGCFGISFTAFGADDIEISVDNFPDPVFREIVRRYDKNQPYGYLSAQERNQSIITITGLTIGSDQTIKTLKGIEYFADSLVKLRCTDIGLEELDVSGLYNLTDLSCMGNQLTSLDVSKNAKLVNLNCSRNQLTSLTLGNLTALEQLHCYINKLPSISVSLLPNLNDFRCEQNELTSLDVSFNTRLTNLGCASNHLVSLDLSKNTMLGMQSDGEYKMIPRESISGQTHTAAARNNNFEISVPFDIPNVTRIVATSLDTNELADGYYSGKFVTYDVESINDGIEYTYSVGNEWVQDMVVNIDVTRDFYQVSYYYDETLSQLIGRAYVNEGQSARIPSFTPPLCKALDYWSEDVSAVTSDMKVYANYYDNHDFDLVSFVDGDAKLKCYVCGEIHDIKFIDCANASEGDRNYHLCLDVVNDGCINAKDFAELEKMFK